MMADAAQPLREGSSISSRGCSTVSETAVLIRDMPQHEPQHEQQQLDSIYTRVSWRLMPLFLAVMILNHVDRTNLAYASISMNADLNIGPATYGLGSALFFIPFCIFQIPSNLVVARVGVRRWLAFLLLGWGAVATCMSAIHSVGSFFALRLLLGAFEAGAVPAMWYHLSSFFPADRITKPFTLLTIGILAAQAVSGPVAAGFLAMNGVAGLHGWRWLFLLEGLPTVLMSVVVWCCLPDSIASATWLSNQDRKLLEADLAAAASKPLVNLHQPSLPSSAVQQPGQQRSHSQHLEDHGFLKLFRSAIRNPYLLLLCVLGIMLASASNTYVFFLPMIINALLKGPSKPPAPGTGGHGGGTKLLPVILTCIPYTLAAISSYCIAHSSQKKKELYIHTAVPAFIGGIFFVLFPFLSRASVVAGFISLVFVAVSAACAIGPKTAIVHKVTMGPSQVVGMPLYNSIIVLGGFFGPLVTGIVVQRTGSFAAISVLFGIFLLIFGGVVILLRYLLRATDKRCTAGDRPCSDNDLVAPAGIGAGVSKEADVAAVDGTGVVVGQPSSARPRAGGSASVNKV